MQLRKLIAALRHFLNTTKLNGNSNASYCRIFRIDGIRNDHALSKYTSFF